MLTCHVGKSTGLIFSGRKGWRFGVFWIGYLVRKGQGLKVSWLSGSEGQGSGFSRLSGRKRVGVWFLLVGTWEVEQGDV